MLQNFEGVKAFTGKTEAESAVAYRKGDILLSNIRPYLKKNVACRQERKLFTRCTRISLRYLQGVS